MGHKPGRVYLTTKGLAYSYINFEDKIRYRIFDIKYGYISDRGHIASLPYTNMAHRGLQLLTKRKGWNYQERNLIFIDTNNFLKNFT